jgi:hypothetical protein
MGGFYLMPRNTASPQDFSQGLVASTDVAFGYIFLDRAIGPNRATILVYILTNRATWK